MNDGFSFIVYGTAAPQGSKRHIGNGVMLESSKRLRPWRQDVRFAALEKRLPGWDMTKPMRLLLEFRFSRPQSHFVTKKGVTYLNPNAPAQPVSARLGDIDKLSRAVLDALTGVAYLDDRQVIILEASKSYIDDDRLPPCTIIAIAPYV